MFKVEIPITAEAFRDQLCTFMESNYSPWCHKVRWAGAKKPRKIDPNDHTPMRNINWYEDEKLFEPGMALEFDYDSEADAEGDNTGRKTVSFNDVVKGLTLFANESPTHFADMIQENGDADTADVMFQFIVLGSHVYG